MRKLLLIFFSLCLFASVEGQMIKRATANAKAQVSTGCPAATYTDNFTGYSSGTALGGQGSWVDVITGNLSYDWTGNMIVYGDGLGNHISLYNNTFCNNQYSQIVDVLVGTYMGVGVRLSGSGASACGYMYVVTNGASFLLRIDNGAETILAEGTAAISANDVIRLEITGTELSCKINGALDTTISTDGKVTDATYSTGKAGIATRANAGSFGDTWQGGNL